MPSLSLSPSLPLSPPLSLSLSLPLPPPLSLSPSLPPSPSLSLLPSLTPTPEFPWEKLLRTSWSAWFQRLAWCLALLYDESEAQSPCLAFDQLHPESGSCVGEVGREVEREGWREGEGV